MIRSMTGYGRGEFSDDSKSIVIEMRAVNHRYCDVSVRMPRRYSFAEKDIVAAVKDRLMRGKIEVSAAFDMFGQTEDDIQLNRKAAESYYKALTELRDSYCNADSVGLSLLAGMPDVIRAVPRQEENNEIKAAIMSALDKALESMCEMREEEGRKLAADLMMRADNIECIKSQISERAPELVAEYKEKIESRITELLDGKAEITPDRIALEAAVFADKSDITEELVRLGSHVDQLRAFIVSDEAALGKKMDFLVQEMNREVNTIGSKTNDNRIVSSVIELKSEIEKIREQIQNIE